MTLAKPLLISFSLLAFAGAAYGQQSQDRQPKSRQAQTQAQQMGQMRTSELIGKEVTNNQGADLGEIKDVVINLQSGRVHAAVLEFGGVLGMGEKQYAFPISQLKAGKDRDKLVLNVPKDRLEKSEGFERNQWPAMDDDYWGRIGDRASVGQTRGQGQKRNMSLVRASELDGKDVKDKAGQDAGEVEEVIVDLNSGRLRSIVIDVEDAGQASVPASALRMGSGDELVLNMSADQLKRQAQRSGKPAQSGASSGGATMDSRASSEDAAARGISGGAAMPERK